MLHAGTSTSPTLSRPLPLAHQSGLRPRARRKWPMFPSTVVPMSTRPPMHQAAPNPVQGMEMPPPYQHPYKRLQPCLGSTQLTSRCPHATGLKSPSCSRMNLGSQSQRSPGTPRAPA